MSPRTIALSATVGLIVLAGVAAFALLRPSDTSPPAPVTLEQAAPLSGIPTASPPSSGSTGPVAAGPPTLVASATVPQAASPQGAVSNGVVFGYVTLAEPAANGEAVLTVDFAEIRPAEENAPTDGRTEITNPTVEAARLVTKSLAKVDASAIGAGTIGVGSWLTKRSSADKTGTALTRSPYWIELRNRRIVRLRLQQVP